ncbi:MAG: hypothetical protein NDJ75_10490, partial [Thermoanaerobaculia bacterium]|nr:hypothetical protein [Thermoanaerobaculia bacterium]
MTEDPRHEPGLFDLPLEPPPPAPARRAARPPGRGESLPLFSDEEIDEALGLPFDEPPARAATEAPAPARRPARPVPVPDPPAAPPLAALSRRG